MRAVDLPSKETIPVLGMGTSQLGLGRHPADVEMAALRTGLDLGITLIDTAEMYGAGASERLVGQAIADRRDDVFLVSKVLPQHATFDATIAACGASLQRLGTDRLDLYLLHRRGAVPLRTTIRAFGELTRTGLIRHWGVGNFDITDMTELVALPGGDGVETDHVLYNLSRRGIEFDLLPWCQRHALPVLAYSPIEQGRLLGHPVLDRIAARHRATPAQVALAWVVSQRGVCAIPEAETPGHVRESAGSLQVVLGKDDIMELDAAFPPPTHPVPLEVI
jgi:diketogulonate reductase-like aldo/keto reductase